MYAIDSVPSKKIKTISCALETELKTHQRNISTQFSHIQFAVIRMVDTIQFYGQKTSRVVSVGRKNIDDSLKIVCLARDKMYLATKPSSKCYKKAK